MEDIMSAITVNSNIQTLTAQRNLGNSQLLQNKSLERLSSGFRINHAADDAAGTAITERMTKQVRGIAQAIRNTNDGVSLIQSAGSDLQNAADILQEMRETAMQSTNPTISEKERTILNKKYSAMRAQLNELAKNASYNDHKLFDGTFSGKSFQIGLDENQTFNISLSTMMVDKIPPHTATVDEKILDDPGILYRVTKAAEEVKDIANADNDALNKIVADITSLQDNTALDRAATLQGIRDKIFNVSGTVPDGLITDGPVQQRLKSEMTEIDNILANKTIADTDVYSITDANNAIYMIDDAIDYILDLDSELGAMENLFDSNFVNLTNVSINTADSRSRIKDVDMAAETAEMAKAQIMVQSGTSMVFQANQLPKNVLALLG
jgi:flagellin